MSVEKSYSVTLKMAVGDDGAFESIRLLRGRSKMPEELLERVNTALQRSLVPAPVMPPPAPSSPPSVIPPPAVMLHTAVAIGADAEQKILNHLRGISAVNMDFVVDDTSSKTGHGDIAVTHRDRRFCIEVKNYCKPVPAKELDKYHRSLALAEYDCGILIQMNASGFARAAGLASPVDLRMVDGKPSVYLTSADPALLYPVINMLIVHVDAGKAADEDELETKRKALMIINDRLVDLRGAIAAQKKAVARMEDAVESIAALSM